MSPDIRLGFAPDIVDNKIVARPKIELKTSLVGGPPFVDFTHSIYPDVRFVSMGAQNTGNIDFEGIATLIADEPTMDPQDSAELKRSWDKGLAVAIIKGEEVVGYSRLKYEGVLSGDGREVFEDSTFFLRADVRRNMLPVDPLAPTMQEALLTLKIDEVRKGNALFISVSDAGRKYASSLHEGAKRLGIRFVPMIHTSIPGMAEKACAGCKLDKSVAWDNGGKDGIACPLRVTEEKLAALVKRGKYPEGDTEKCLLYMSMVDTVHPKIPQKALVFNSKNGVGHATI